MAGFVNNFYVRGSVWISEWMDEIETTLKQDRRDLFTQILQFCLENLIHPWKLLQSRRGVTQLGEPGEMMTVLRANYAVACPCKSRFLARWRVRATTPNTEAKCRSSERPCRLRKICSGESATERVLLATDRYSPREHPSLSHCPALQDWALVPPRQPYP